MCVGGWNEQSCKIINAALYAGHHVMVTLREQWHCSLIVTLDVLPSKLGSIDIMLHSRSVYGVLKVSFDQDVT